MIQEVVYICYIYIYLGSLIFHRSVGLLDLDVIFGHLKKGKVMGK